MVHKTSNESKVVEEGVKSFREGAIPEDKFTHFRLLRGVYGQRQKVEKDGWGVQMLRIKIPYGKLTPDQLHVIGDIAEEYTNSNLHTTTRQNIQLHHVRLDDSPEILDKLENAGLTTREACGNTVRNITASPNAGIDPEEPFDVSPYAYEMFRYFLYNPICQDMGRKFKPAFSSGESDSAFTYIHDIGFIPRIRKVDGEPKRGFKVVAGGGLGAQSKMASTAYEFIEDDQIIPFTEALLRIFDRYGERNKRFKARIKFLIEKWGIDKVIEEIDKEWSGLKNKRFKVTHEEDPTPELPGPLESHEIEEPADQKKYEKWLKSNVFEQKQEGFFGVNILLPIGNIHSPEARSLAEVVKKLAAPEIRVTQSQGLLLKYVRKEALTNLFNRLNELGLADDGFESLADVTACPGTDTCNLGVTNSTLLAGKIQELVRNKYKDLIDNDNISINISGCMNACGQHMIGDIGLHGSSIKAGQNVIPAMQVVMGGGLEADGTGHIAEKVIKLPTKRIPRAIENILEDYKAESSEEESFGQYFRRQGKMYFFNLLTPLADKENVTEEEIIDWGQDKPFKPEIGAGECAGAAYDVVDAILKDTQNTLQEAEKSFNNENWGDAIYHSYNVFVNGAKALLLANEIQSNRQIDIIENFDNNLAGTEGLTFPFNFKEKVLELRENEPSEEFARQYKASAEEFLNKALATREDRELNKTVKTNEYKA